MIDFKNILSLNYNKKLLESLISLTPLGVFAANILSPILMAYVLYTVIPHFQIYIWLSLHLFIFFGRILISKKLHHSLNTKSTKSTKYLKIIFFLTTISTLLYGLAVWSSFSHEASDLHIFIISMILVSLAAGALSTLISIYKLYALFVVFSMVPLITMILYHGGDIFNIFAFVLTIFTISILIAGYRQYKILENIISLEETFQTIYEKSSDGIALIQNNRFKDCNEAIVKMFQYKSKEDLLHTHLVDFMPKRQSDGVLSVKKMIAMTKTTLDSGTNKFEWIHKRKNGELFWVEIVLTAINLNNEQLIHGTWRDISDRKQLEENQKLSRKKIEKLNDHLQEQVSIEVIKNQEKDQILFHQSRLAQIGKMLSMIAHQWRQPLAAISATSATLELKANMHTLKDDEVQKKAHAISDYSQHLSKTIDNFKSFYTPTKDKVETSYTKMIESVLYIIDTSLKNKNIRLVTHLHCHETFNTYPCEITQVILNLITNAQEALEEKETEDPYIKLESYTKDDKYILQISDNAGGITEKNIAYIFDPYFSTKKAKNGTGLGLYMSKIIIDEHCMGILSVKNTNSGALFSIELPKNIP